jgi:hypothetical protein
MAIKGGYTHPLIKDLGYGQAHAQMKGYLVSKHSHSKIADDQFTNRNWRTTTYNPYFDYLPNPTKIHNPDTEN